MRKPRRPQSETKNLGRDLFQTPNYATFLLLPFIPKNIKRILEPANGKGKITNVLRYAGYSVTTNDISDVGGYDFVNDDFCVDGIDAIITNPPYSIKRKFYRKLIKLNIPFAILIHGDYCQWLIDAIRYDNCEKIIPSRRIDYITPTGLSGATGNKAYWHSIWLTYKFNLGKSETFVELTDVMKQNI